MTKRSVSFDEIESKRKIVQTQYAKEKQKDISAWVMRNSGLLIILLVTIVLLGFYAIVQLFVVHTNGMCIGTFIYLFGLAVISWIKKRKK